jgi:hypothetical protein
MSLGELVFLPAPRSITPRPGALALAGAPAVATVRDPVLPAQGYRLRVGPDGVELAASDDAGWFYGRATLAQLQAQCEASLPACEIVDAPDFATRGVMLDISRDKVPTMATLLALVDDLAAWKVNHLELYTEHTFAYRNHREVWAQASPMIAEEIRTLDAYCRERFIELVPNQNSLGHFHRWLDHPRYRHLAECPDGFDVPKVKKRDGPWSLAPTHPGTLTLLAELYAELLPNFTSRKLNVGCDEPFDLGLGHSQTACQDRGKGRVYVDFLVGVHELCARHGRTMEYWADVVNEHPELIPELPRDAIALEWGYDVGHPFADHCARLAAAGISYYVCPGTSSWNTIAGRTDNCLANLRSATREGHAHGATGVLNTDWGDGGHWQYLPVSYLGFAAGAALAWSGAANREADLVTALDRHVFRDRAGVMGRLVFDLGNAYQQVGVPRFNGSPLFDLLRAPAEAPLPAGVTPAALARTRAYVEAVIEPLARARMDRSDAALITAELANAARMLLLACAAGAPPTSAAPARLDRAAVVAEHQRLWLARNRPGGFDDSVRRLR